MIMMMAEPEMYPLVDHPSYTQKFQDFAELRDAVEALNEGLNFPLSWFIFDDRSEDWEGSDGVKDFSLCIVMPRRSETTQFTTESFRRSEVEAWLAGYIKGRVDRWYGWSDLR